MAPAPSSAARRHVQGSRLMNLHRTLRGVAVGALAASSLAAVSIVAPFASASASAANPACVSANLPKTGTVNITFWEAMSAANEALIQKLVAKFNASQKTVHV